MARLLWRAAVDAGLETAHSKAICAVAWQLAKTAGLDVEDCPHSDNSQPITQDEAEHEMAQARSLFGL